MYIGKTEHRLHYRIKEHLSPKSAVGIHVLSYNVCATCSFDDLFSVLDSASHPKVLSMLEATYINNMKPVLNTQCKDRFNIQLKISN